MILIGKQNKILKVFYIGILIFYSCFSYVLAEEIEFSYAGAVEFINQDKMIINDTVFKVSDNVQIYNSFSFWVPSKSNV